MAFMNGKDKLIERFKRFPSDFAFDTNPWQQYYADKCVIKVICHIFCR